MGCSIGYAVGTQIANPNKTVISIDGDGSFNMTLNELKTIKEYNLPIKIAVINDNALMMVKFGKNCSLKKDIQQLIISIILIMLN